MDCLYFFAIKNVFFLFDQSLERPSQNKNYKNITLKLWICSFNSSDFSKYCFEKKIPMTEIAPKNELCFFFDSPTFGPRKM